MYGNLVAFCLLAMPVVAAWAMIRAWSPPSDRFWLKVWPTAWFPALWLFVWYPFIFTQANPPFECSYWMVLLPLASWLAVALFSAPGRTRRTALCAVVALLALMLPLWPGSEWTAASRDWKAKRVFPSVRSRLYSIADVDLPAGWIDRKPLADLLKADEFGDWVDLKARHIHHRQWHTWLTGIYRIENKPAGVWYPGGKPIESADKLEWRER